jgi:hypothetical protein
MGIFLSLDSPNKYINIDGIAIRAGGGETTPTGPTQLSNHCPHCIVLLMHYICGAGGSEVLGGGVSGVVGEDIVDGCCLLLRARLLALKETALDHCVAAVRQKIAWMYTFGKMHQSVHFRESVPIGTPFWD